MQNKIHHDDRLLIKEKIVTLMLSSPEAVQKQLSDAILQIGKHDFPENWPNLLPKIIENFASFAGMYLNIYIAISSEVLNLIVINNIYFSCANR